MPGSFTNLDGFELLAETLGEMVSRHAPDDTYTYASPAARALFGYEPEELVGHSTFEFLHPDDVDDVRGAHSTLLNGEERVVVRYRHRHKSGGYVECEASGRAVRDGSGALAEVITVKRDIGEKVAGDFLRRQWEICFKRTSRGTAVIDAATQAIVSLNRALAEMHGGTVRDFVGKPLRTLLSAEAAERVPDVSTAIDDDAVVSYESEHVRLDGTTFPVYTEVAVARDEDGSVRYRIAWYDDLTERQAVERRAGLAQRDFEAAFNAARTGSRSSASTAPSSTSTRSWRRSSATRPPRWPTSPSRRSPTPTTSTPTSPRSTRCWPRRSTPTRWRSATSPSTGT